MNGILAHPAGQSVVVPLAVALVATGLLRLIGGGRGPTLAAAGLGLGFLAGYGLILGIAPLPPRSAGQKLFYIVALAWAAGVALDLAAARPLWRHGLAVVGSVAAVVWLLGAQLGAETMLWPGSVLVAAWVLVLERLSARSGQSLDGAVMLIVVGLAGAGVAFFGATASGAQLSLALAAAAGGFALWNWPVVRFRFAAAAVYAGGAAALALASQFVLYTQVSPWALLLLVLVFFVDRWAARLSHGLGDNAFARALAPVVLALVAAIPAGAALAVAYLSAGAG